MIKNTFKILLGGLLLGGNSILAEVPTSGIDWSASTMEVTFAPPVLLTQNIPTFDCFGGSANPAITDLDSLGFSDSTLDPHITTCFKQAGDYEVQIKLVDNAANEIFSDLSEIIVYPGNAVVAQAVISGGTDCDDIGDSVVADGADLCDYTLLTKDENLNPITGRTVEIRFDGQDVSVSEYDVITDPNAHLKGLRFDDAGGSETESIVSNQAVLTTLTNVDGSPTPFKTKALVPFLEIISGTGAHSDFKLGRKLAKNQYFSVLVFDIEEDGTQASTGTDVNGFSGELQTLFFKPWFQIDLSDNSAYPSNPSDPFQISFDVLQKIYGHMSSANLVNLDLPSSVDLWLKGYSPSGTAFRSQNLTAGHTKNVGGISGTSSSPFINTHFERIAPVTGSEDIIFASKVSYDLSDGFGTKTVTFPTGNLGSAGITGLSTIDCTNIPGCENGTTIETLAFIGADIEGNILSDGSSDFGIQVLETLEGESGDSKALVSLGDNKALDIREELTRNVYSLTRGKAQITGDQTVSNIVFADGEVRYYSGGTVRLSGTVTGRGTIVIENGNLFITGDLNYANSLSSLGVVLINSVTENYPTEGNVFVHNDVQHVVGTYFGDGGLMSTNALTTAIPAISDVVDLRDASSFGKQLILEGTLFMRNTLGGALLGGGAATWASPWENTASVTEAQALQYDLHFMRRYSPYIPNPSAPPALIAIADAVNGNCWKDGGSVCDANRHAFVVRPDGKVQNQTPPGFNTVFGGISR